MFEFLNARQAIPNVKRRCDDSTQNTAKANVTDENNALRVYNWA